MVCYQKFFVWLCCITDVSEMILLCVRKYFAPTEKLFSTLTKLFSMKRFPQLPVFAYCFVCLIVQLGIVGRTGSGKSSLFQVLFRMINSYQGAVLIDGINIASVPLDILRLVLLCDRLGEE